MIGGALPPIAQTALVGLVSRRRRAGVVIHRPGREPLEALLEAGTVAPVVDSTYALEDARAAFERYASGEFVGKVVITTPSDADEGQLRLGEGAVRSAPRADHGDAAAAPPSAVDVRPR